MDTTLLLQDLVRVNAGFKPSVQLPADFEDEAINTQLIRTYIPTSQTITLFVEIARSLGANDTERVRSLIGTYGTGKSDLLLMICNYFAHKANDPIMAPFYEKLQAINEAQHATIYQSRANKESFLVVLLQPDPMTQFPGFVIYGLEQALARKGLSHLMNVTKYAAARKQIETWQQENTTLLNEFSKRLREAEGKELSTLLAELNSPQSDYALSAFMRTFRAVTSTDFNVYAYGQPNDVYSQVSRQLAKNGYSGILLVCDEFTEFLRRFEHAIDQQNREVDSETLAVQNLAETSERSGTAQIHFIVASLEGFASASASSSSGQASKAIERLGGRFRSYPLMTQGSEELIRGALQKTAQGAALSLIPNAQRDELIGIAEQFYRPQGKLRQWIREVVVDGVFPLHPLTSFVLPLINQLVAQSQRTMFLFLNDAQGLAGYLAATPLLSSYTSWSNLLTIDYLYDYFEESISVRRSEVREAYDQAIHQITNATVDTALARRVLKVLALSEVVRDIPTTQIGLRQALNLPPSAEQELKIALNTLDQLDAIVAPHQESGPYNLAMIGRVSSSSLRRRISARAQEISVNVQHLTSNPDYQPKPISADSYNSRRGTHRKLSAFYVSSNDLNSTARLTADLKQARDGVVWYVITSSEVERVEALTKARELTTRHEQLLVAIPMKPLDILNRLREYQAVQDVMASTDGNAREYLSSTGRIGRAYHESLMLAVNALHQPNQWEWFLKGSAQPHITGLVQLQDLASNVMQAVFRMTPEHQLGQHLKEEGLSKPLRDAASEILKGEVRIDKNKKGPSDIILRKALVDLGLLKLQKIDGSYEVFEIVKPDDKFNSLKVWQLIYQQVQSDKWSALIASLRKASYGLYDSHLLLFMAAFFTKHADEIAIKSIISGVQRSVTINVDILEKLITTPSNFALSLQPLGDPERRWLRGLVATATKHGFDPSGGRGTTLRDRVVEQLRPWVRRLQLPLFAEKLDALLLEPFFPELSSELRIALVILIQANRIDSPLASALASDLPVALSMPKDRRAWTDEHVENSLNIFATVCRALEELPSRLEKHAVERVASIFGCETDKMETAWNTIYQWRANRDVINPGDLPGNPRILFMLTNKPSRSIKEAFLEDFAKEMTGVHLPYQQWSTVAVLEKVEQEIRKSYDEIERRWKDRAPKEELWRSGVLRAATGRPSVHISKEIVSRALVEWTAAVQWPACTATLTPQDIQLLYPGLDIKVCTDIMQIFRRVGYTAQNWAQELGDALPKQFGVENWLSKPEVDEAVNRFSKALQYAQTIDTVLRQHVLEGLTHAFNPKVANQPIAEIINGWLEAHPIPSQNDLSEAAIVLLQQLKDSAVPETTLLNTLPRALPGIEQALLQWLNYAKLNQYVAMVKALVQEINAYVPLSDVEYRWLSGMITQGIHQPLLAKAYEQSKLAQAVYQQFTSWISELDLPNFSSALTIDELGELYPDTQMPILRTIHLLLRTQHTAISSPVSLLLTQLPKELGSAGASQTWSVEEVNSLLDTLSTACKHLAQLAMTLRRKLYEEISSAFGIPDSVEAGALMANLWKWREEIVLFKGEKLSDKAELLYNTLARSTDDAEEVLLHKLPQRIGRPGIAYARWTSWDMRHTYIENLAAAAQEIEQVGQVSDASPHVRAFWVTLKQQIEGLSPDERRWLIKAFDESYRI